MDQPELLSYVANALERTGVPYLLVGSFASSIWGEPRLTLDIDMVIDVRLDQIPLLCRAFPSPEFYVSEPAALDAVQRKRQFNVIHPSSGNKIDFIISREDAWNRMQLTRGSRHRFDEHTELRVCSPEDVIISKMRYFQEGQSPKHLRDIAGILDIQSDRVDHEYIQHWAKEFGLTEIWQGVLKSISR